MTFRKSLRKHKNNLLYGTEEERDRKEIVCKEKKEEQDFD
jgi:hypothetical protein